MKKLIFGILLVFTLLPVTIYAAKTSEECETGFRRNPLGICEGRKSSGLSSKAPENGKLNKYKDAFECERGFVKNKNNWSCDEIKLPENGVLTIVGNDWTCIPNYKKVGDKCEKVTLPENAKFAILGSDWYCIAGYKKQDNKCIKLEVPAYATANYIGSFNCHSGFKRVGDNCEKQPSIENGTFYTQGANFYCNNGYKKNESDRKCEKIKIPDQAREDNLSLGGWTCHREFIKEGPECKKITLPDNADWNGNTWKCKQGYRKNPTNKSCDKINLPENAHYTDTYDGWLCNNGYTKNYKENRCDIDNN